MIAQDYRKTALTHRVGLAAAKPAASNVLAGTLYYSTDTGTLERSNGSGWEPFASTSSGGGLVAHAATHDVGGTDELINAAWVSQPNTFEGDQTIDGDLFVTGTITPVTKEILEKINKLIGDPTGSRMLMSSNYVSGLSLRHDEDAEMGRIACGNYDTQTYQPLVIESEDFKVKTGFSPPGLREHLRVHPSGGVTVGEETDHDVDPGIGVVKAYQFIPTIQGPQGPKGDTGPVGPGAVPIEGSWTPVFRGDGGGVGPTYLHNYGQYVKLGRAVIIIGSVQLSSKGSMVGNILLDGLPFQSQALAYSAITTGRFAPLNLGGINYFPSIAVWPGTSYGYMQLTRTDGTAIILLQGLHLADDTIMFFSGVYIAAS